MSEATFMPVITTIDYEVTAKETIYKSHKGTNQVLEVIEKTVLNKVLYPATSEELAIFAALKDIENVGKVVLSNVKVTACPFR